MATYYVSNAAVNGSYVVGNDSNNGTAVTTPFLTIAKAMSASTTGDTVIINPTSSSSTSANHPYSETTSVAVAHSLTIEADPTYVNTTNKFAVVQSTGSGTVWALSGTSITVVMSDIVCDCQATSNKHAIQVTNTETVTFNRMLPVNGAGSATLYQIHGATSVYTFNQCVIDASNTYTTFIGLGSAPAAGSSVTFTGGTYAATGTGTTFGTFGSGTLGTLSVQADGSSNPATFSGAGTAFLLTSMTTGSITMNNFIANNTKLFVDFSATSTLTGTHTYNNGTITYGSNAAGAWVANLTEACTVPSITNCTIDGTALAYNTSIVGIYIPNGTGSPVISGNTITWNSESHAIQIGVDGYTTDVTNHSTATGTHKFGDVSNNTYIDQWTTTSTAASSTTHSSYITDIVMSLQKTGSPTGNITCGMYADSAGSPGTLIANSTTTVNAASLSSSSQQYWVFAFPQTYVAGGTKIHFVFQYTGTINNTDYILMNENTTTTVGSIFTAPDGVTWTADTGHCLWFWLETGTYAITDARVFNNYVLSTYGGTITGIIHMIAMAAQVRGWAYDNIIIGGNLGVMFKENAGGTGGNPALAFNNLIFQTSGGYAGVGLLYNKGSGYVNFYNNIAIQGTSGVGAAMMFSCDTAIYNPQNALTANNSVCENNILINQASAAAPYMLVTNSKGDALVSITINNNVVWNPNGGSIGWLTNYNNSGGYTNPTATYTWAQWRALGYDTNGTNNDPLLTNETTPAVATDFLPLKASPARGLGISTGGLVVDDYNGNAYATVPDAGAFNLGSSYTYPAPKLFLPMKAPLGHQRII